MSSYPAGTRTCPQCQMQVPAKAYVCAYCKKRIRTGPVAMGCLVLVVFVVLVSIFPSSKPISTSLAPPPQPAPTIAPEEAARQAKEAKLEEQRFLKTRAGRLWTKHKDWSRELCETIAQRNIHIGMTSDQVRAAWGKPESINSSVYSFGTHEQWVYGVGQYVYFENGIMTSLQQSK